MTTPSRLKLYDALHGKTYVYQGVSGEIRHGDRPFGPAEGILIHRPDAIGVQSDAYHTECAKHGLLVGTWVTDLTRAETLGECSIDGIARELGVEVAS